MADDATTTAAAAPATAGATTEPPSEKTGETGKTFTQEQVNDLLALQKGKVERRFEGFDELKAKAEKLDELEESQRSETERLIKERDGLKEKLSPLETENLRLRVALDKKLPAPLIDRLQGGSKEEMETDADELLKLVGTGESEQTTDFEGGARTTPPVQKKPEDAHNEFLQALLEGKEPTT